jgi:biopolymer transport protein ExbB
LSQSGNKAPKLLTFGEDEQKASFVSGYFAVILKSVTPDGWV